MCNKKIKLVPVFLALFTLAYFPSFGQSFINVWGGGGYTSLYHGIENTKFPGGIGYNFGAGYEYKLNNFMISTGAEFMHFNSTTKLNAYNEHKDFLYPYPVKGHAGDYYITYPYKITDHNEKHSFGYLNIPLQVGFKFDRYYAIVGAKVGLNLFGSYKSIGNIQTEGVDPMFIDTLTNIPVHYFGEKLYDDKGKLSLGLNITPGVEFGVYLDEWLGRNFTQLNNRNKTNISYRAGVFVDYGMVNLNTSTTDNPLLTDPKIDPLDVTLNSLSGTVLSKDKRFGSLFAGIKLTVSFDMTKRKAAPKAAVPTIPFYAQAVDVETNEGLDAKISLRYAAGNRVVFNKKTDADGFIKHDGLRNGRYTIAASSTGYFDNKQAITHGKLDTVIIALQRQRTIFVRVTDAKTNEKLQATVTISSEQDNKQLFSKNTNPADGMINNDLLKGRYLLNVTSEGYIYHQETIDHTKTDTIHVALQPVEKETRVILHNLFFEFDSSIIKDESQTTIDELYQFLTNNPEIRIQIVGHTDNVGTEQYNKTLSENRAKSVYDAVVKKGISSDRLSWAGKGATDPITTNDTEEGRAENRRVEFVIL